MKFLVTGAAGFIGFHTAARLLDRGETVVGVDNLNSYYDPSLKEARLAILQGRNGFTFYCRDIADRGAMAKLFKSERPDKVIHLAAQAGVRPGGAGANSYIDSNIVGTQNVLEGCRHTSVKHLVLASSSSVYGAQYRHAIQRARQCRPPPEPLRRNEEGERARRACLCASVRVAR